MLRDELGRVSQAEVGGVHAVRPLRIVHVLGSLEVGGAEQVAVNLANEQVKAGHVVQVVSLHTGAWGPHRESFEAVGAKVVNIPKRGPTLDPTLVLRLAAHLRRVKADVVHTHNPHPVIYGAPAARLARIPCVHTKHGANVASKRSSLLRRLSSRLATVVVGVSAETARQACAQGEAEASAVQVIDNGINVERYARDDAARLAVRDELGIPTGAVVVGTVGRMVPAKNQVLLVKAMAPLVGPNVHLVIVGDGPLRADVEAARAACERPQYIHLLGRRLDVVRLLSGFDVFALSSDTEGLPMVLPEAMACSLPVVATSVGGIPGVIEEGKDGFVVPPQNESALRDSIARLVNDSSLRETMGNAARINANQRYSARAMHAKYESLYASLLRK